ncbi:hypothetical protein A7W90_16220 [Clostridium sp. Bc-iso-3]|nr:hypothetical protein A7W90_16220 [Clostridium sp. Bc-iso-3]
MTLQNLKNLLLTIGPPVFHYFASGQTRNYIVWAEDGEGASGHADNKKTTQVISGTIDYFTKDEFDPVTEQIQGKLNDSRISWRLNSVRHEKETGYIHYEWTWEMI